MSRTRQAHRFATGIIHGARDEKAPRGPVSENAASEKTMANPDRRRRSIYQVFAALYPDYHVSARRAPSKTPVDIVFP